MTASTAIPQTPPRYRLVWIDLLILLAGVALIGSIAGWRMTHYAMWGDEVRTWRDSVGKSYHDILTWTHNADHAPLGHLLTKLCSDLFHSQSPSVLRLPAFLFGLAIVPLGYLLGRLAHGRVAGLLIVAMVSVDVTVTTQAHQARMYTQFLAWTIASLCCVAWMLRDNATSRSLAKAPLLGLFLAMSLWTHYSAMSLLIAMLVAGVVMLIVRAWRVHGAALLVSVGIACALSIQGLMKLIAMRTREALPGADRSDAIGQLLDACRGLMGNEWLCIGLFVLASVGLGILFNRQRTFALVLILSAAVGIASLLTASLYRQIEGPRYLLGFLPACWLGLAVVNATILAHRNRWVRIAIVTLLVAGVSYQLLRTITAAPHPLARTMRDVAATLPTLGYVSDAPIVFAPADPLQMGGRFYGLRHDAKLHGRILAALKLKQATPQTLGRGRPDELWMVISTSCRKSQRGTPQDGVATAMAAAGFYGQAFDVERVPYTPDVDGELRIVRLTPTSLEIWDSHARRLNEPRTK